MIEEPESLLARLRKLEAAATPAPWVQEHDSSAFYSLVDDRHLVGDAGSQDREFIVTLRNLAPEIIEAFELLAEIPSPAAEDWRKRIDTLLSKVSGQNG